jgi:carboxypeptidase C (cathepsin A)/photosystem II stability/assembly factor-like uncharacterized protein
LQSAFDYQHFVDYSRHPSDARISGLSGALAGGRRGESVDWAGSCTGAQTRGLREAMRSSSNQSTRCSRSAWPYAVVALGLILLVAANPCRSQSSYDGLLFTALSWRNIGPFLGGRATTAVGVPGHPKTYYMGATGGGVWKTENSGQTWQNISDGFFRTGSIGDIAVYAANPNIIYVGTGEAPVRGQMSSTGDGVYKSTDGGKTWSHAGLEKTLQISRVVIHPTNPNLVYVAAQGNRWTPSNDRGIYRSSDGGATWKRILFASDIAGASELQMDPHDPGVLYAAFWDLRRFPWAIRSGGHGSGIWKSVDGGDHWTQLTVGLPELMGKIRLAVSPANTSRLYAAIECQASGLFRSDDAGKTWQQVNHQGGLATRPWYYMGVTADPKNEDIVYFSGASLLKSVDGGKTFSEIKTRHSDTHTLWINPSDPQNLVDTDDGGTEISFDGGQLWSPIDNQPTGQFYGVQTDDEFPYHVYGGQQDSGALEVSSRALIGGDRKNWKSVANDESARFAFDPKNPRIVYTNSYQGILHRTDTKTGLSRDVSAWPGQKVGIDASQMTYRFGWSAPVVASPFDPNMLYHGANVLFRTTDQGETWAQISPDLTRNDKTHQGRSGMWWHDGSGGEIYNTIYSIVESPHERGTIWVGTDDGLVQLTRDDGQTWTNVTPKDWSEGWVYSIEVSPHNKATAYVALSRHRTGDPTPHLYKTTDYGKTWTDLAVTLPQDYPARVVREDPKRPGLLYAATEYDVWVSFDDGEHWQSFQRNLPHVPISDLTIHGDDLIAATEGRGFWILDDITPMREMAPDIAKVNLHLFKPRGTYRLAVVPPDPLAPSGANPPNGVLIRYSLGHELSASDMLRLEIVDAQGEVVRTYRATKPAAPPTSPAADKGMNQSKVLPPKPESTPKIATTATQNNAHEEKAVQGSEEHPDEEGHAAPAYRPIVLTGNKGLNQLVWDFRGAPIPGASGNGPLLPSGKYVVRVTLDMTSVSEPVEVLPDPRTRSTPESQKEHLALTRHLMEVSVDTNAELTQLKDVLKQTRELQSHSQSAPAKIREAISPFETQLDTLDRQFEPYQPDPKNMAGDQTALTVGVGPMELLSEFQSAVDTEDGPITQGERLRAKELEGECVHLRLAAEKTMSTGIAKVNAVAASAGLKPAITRHPAAQTGQGPAPLVPEAAIRSGKVLVRGKTILYRVETGEMVMRNAAGVPRATIFSLSYLAHGTAKVDLRPVTFIFNGGPGGATWPLREAISPKMIVPAAGAPGFAFANNPDSLIDASDLVFIDAPGTGYSRFLAEDAKPEYWGIEEDGRAFGEFIANWLDTHHRDSSPKFILGESYGGTRTAQILKTLAARPEGPIRFRGVVLISPSLGTGSTDAMTQGAAAALPTEAVIARYYDRGNYTSKTLDEVANEAQVFSAGSYAAAIRAGKALPEQEKEDIAKQVSAFIGISADEIVKSDLLLPTMKFRDLLLADKGEQLGFDARQHHPKPKPGETESVLDTAGGYDLQAAIVSLIRDELGYKAIGPYVRDPIEANRAWDNTITSEPSSLPEILKAAAATDPHFHVFLGGGYFDLIIPYFLPLGSLNTAGLPPKQFSHHVYPSAHAFLNDKTNRARATDDLRIFFRDSQ